MELELSETRPENQYIYIITCIQIDTTDIIPLLDTFTLMSGHCDFKDRVVPTTFIIKHRQLPAQRFVNCLAFL